MQTYYRTYIGGSTDTWSPWQRFLNVGWNSTDSTYGMGSSTSPIYISSTGAVRECSLTPESVGA